MKTIIISFIKKHKTINIFVFVSILYMLTTMIIPVYTSSLINNLTGVIKKDKAYYLIAIIFVLSVLTQIFYYIKDYNKMILIYKLQEMIEQNILKNLYKTSYIYLENQDKVYLSQRAHSEANIVGTFVLEHIAGLITNLLTFVFAEIILFLINPFFAIISFLSVPVYLVLLYKMKDKVYTSQKLGKESDAILKSTLYEQIRMIPIVKLNAIEKESISIYHFVFQSFVKLSKQIFNYMYLFYSIDGYLTAIVQILFFLFGVNLISENSMNIGEFTIILSYHALIMGAVRYFLNFTREYVGFKSSIDFINEILNYKKESVGDIEIQKIKSISVNNFDFKYENSELLHYDQMNFQNKGIILIKGKNGCGKTTFLNIISTLYETNGPAIQVNGISITKLDLEIIRKKIISYVPQESCLWSLTLRENVQLQLQNIHCFNEFEKLIHSMGLQLFYKSAKHFEEEDWEKNVSSFSIGQVRKLTILLELLKQKHIILFDEPTASLDVESCKEFINYLKTYKQNHLILVVSHDNQFDNICDTVIGL